MKLYNLRVPVVNETGDGFVIDENTGEPVMVDNNNFTAAEVDGESVLPDVDYGFLDNVRYSVKLKIDESKEIKDFSFANMPFSDNNCSYWIRFIKIPEGVTSIGDGAFTSCAKLSSITIPDSVTSIGMYAFDSCRNLSSVTIGSGVTSIGNGIFNNCGNLYEITYNGTVDQWQQIDGYDRLPGNNCPMDIVHCLNGDYQYEYE